MPDPRDPGPRNPARRRFLLLAAAGLAGAGVLYAGRHRIRLLLPGERKREKLLRFVHHRDQAQRLGAAYLATRPGEQSLDAVLEILQRDLGVDPTELKQDQLAQAISRLVEADYQHHRLVETGGWLVSVSEARIAALAAL